MNGCNLREVASDIPYERAIPVHLPEILIIQPRLYRTHYARYPG
jgi:hypothetical protein